MNATIQQTKGAQLPTQAAERAITMNAVSAARYGGPEVLEVKSFPVPEPGENQVRVRVYSAPVTAAGSFMREGKPLLGRLMLGLFRPKHEIPGTGFSGEIDAVGPGVTQWREGDQVFGETLWGLGTHAEYACVEADGVITSKPSNVTHAEVSPVTDGHLTSLNFLKNLADLKEGQRILIIGASGALGTAAVQLARIMGAEVTGVCSGRNTEMVKGLGAHTVIDYHTQDWTQVNEKFDVIYDTAGKSTYRTCKKLLTAQGIYMSPVLGFKLLLQMMWTSKFSQKKAKFSATGMISQDLQKMMLLEIRELIAQGKMGTVIDRKYPLSQVAEANAWVDSGRKVGNVVLTL